MTDSNTTQNLQYLSDVIESARQYVTDDPNAALFRLRQFNEDAVDEIARLLGIDLSLCVDRSEAINTLRRKGVTKDVCSALHTVRKWGNQAAHDPVWGGRGHALEALHHATMLFDWMCREFGVSLPPHHDEGSIKVEVEPKGSLVSGEKAESPEQLSLNHDAPHEPDNPEVGEETGELVVDENGFRRIVSVLDAGIEVTQGSLREAASHLESVRCQIEEGERIAFSPFRLGIVGEARAGKSTLVNVLAGEPIALVDVTETTAVLGCYRHSPEKTARLHFGDGRREDWDPQGLTRELSERRSDVDWLETIDFAEFQTNDPALAGLVLWDGPGIGGADHNEAVANAFLDRVNAAILVFDIELLGSGATAIAMERLKRAGKPVLIVINRIDGHDPDEVKEAVDYVRDSYGSAAVDIIPMSASESFERLLANELDPNTTILRDSIQKHLVDVSKETRELQIRRAEEECALRAVDGFHDAFKSLAERIGVIDWLEERLRRQADSVQKLLPKAAKAVAESLWAIQEDELQRLLSANLGRGKTMNLRATSGLMESINGVFLEAKQALDLDATWRQTTRQVLERLGREWESQTGRVVETVEVFAHLDRSFQPVGYEQVCEDVDERANAYGKVVGGASATALGVLAAASSVVTWPAILAAAPVGLVTWWLRRESEVEEKRRRFHAAEREGPGQLARFFREARTFVRNSLVEKLTPRVNVLLETHIAESTTGEKARQLAGLPIAEARTILERADTLRATLVPFLDDATRKAVKNDAVWFRPDAEGRLFLSRVLGRKTAEICLMGPTVVDELTVILEQVHPKSGLRLILTRNQPARSESQTELLGPLFEQCSDDLSIQVRSGQAKGQSGAERRLLVADDSSWVWFGPLTAGFAVELSPFEKGRLAARREFEEEWSIAKPVSV